MAVDPYALCPCGSSKKIKFCCHAVLPEMEKISRLRENKQASMAMQKLAALQEKHPGNPLVTITQTELFISERAYDKAIATIGGFSKENKDHKYALILHSMALLTGSGFAVAKRTVHRSFQKCGRSHPDAICQIASGIASMMYANESYMSARQHLAVALRYANEQQRQQLFYQMASLEGNDEIPYPLRSVHQLLPYSGSEDNETEASRAAKLSLIGCWEPASILFGRLTEADPDSAVLWHNLGLCHAWDGNEPAAATAFHKAAELFGEDNLDAAVESETLAQLLDLETTDQVTPFVSQRFTVPQISKLLTTLDAHERFCRVEREPEENQQVTPVAVYSVVDKTSAAGETGESWTFDDVPTALADVTIYDNNENAQVSGAYLTGTIGEEFDTATALLKEAAGDQVSVSENDKQSEVGVVPTEMIVLQWAWHFPKSVPDVKRRQLEQSKWSQVTTSLWTDAKLSALGDKSPREFASDGADRVKLYAVVNVLDAYCVRQSHALGRASVEQELKLEPQPTVDLDDSTPVIGLSTLQLQRIAIDKLSDDQLCEIVNRALLVRHPVFLEQILAEVVKREPCMEKVGPIRVFSGLYRCCREQGRREESLKWLRSARDTEPVNRTAFEHRMEWDLRELNFRMENPADPELPPLVKRIQGEYAAKLPELNQVLTETLAEVGLQHLISQTAIVAPTESDGADIVWTPEGGGPESSDDGDKKLWVPGQ